MEGLGKWNWLSKATSWVKKNFGSVPGVNLVCAIVDTINNQFKINDPTLTPNENLALSTWEETLFLPFLEYVLRKQAIIYDNTAIETNKIQVVNSILVEINAVMMYYSKNPDNISEKASEVRRIYVDKFLGAIQENIYNEFIYVNSFETELYTSTLNATTLNVMPLALNVSFSVDLIKIQGVAVAETIATQVQSQTAVLNTVATAPLVSNAELNSTTKIGATSILKVLAFLGISGLLLKYAFTPEKK